jgi:hypothetical protein
MSRTDSIRRKPAAPATAVLVLLLACLGLAACGGSSSSSSTGTTAAATGTGAKGANAGRFTAVRECLQKQGITLPQRTPGQKRPGGGAGGFLGGGAGTGGAAGSAGGPQLPKGVTRARYEAALKKCGAGKFGARGGGARFKSPAFQAALAKFATCMRANGVNVPAPNTSGDGPVFDTKGIDTTSAKFKAAEAKCQSDLSGAFRRGPGAGGSGAGSGAAPGTAPPRSGEAPGGATGPPPAG